MANFAVDNADFTVMDNTRKFFILAAFAFLFTVTCKAQDVSLNAKDMPARFDESALQRIMPTRYGGRSRQWREEAMAEAERQSQHQDSLMLPPLNAQGQVDTTCRYPWLSEDGTVGDCIADLTYRLARRSLPNSVKGRTAEPAFSRT